MDAIEKRAREVLAAELEKSGDAENAAWVRSGAADGCVPLRAIIAALTPPDEPDPALLISMAVCLRHGFGLDTAEQQQAQLRDMRKLWDEVMGRGYYSSGNRERYTAMIAARPEVP
ncbi:hypothetical protein JAK62_19590 [Stenotrophomonas maltophilia]|uniref:hypothetical protein n=1 Tax=Stenotrophomonas maltophilia TaxID=40324 RepID=UPI0021C6B7A9|nr:hypothetical protein [Stenotrophomonas maltophilia]MCU1193532.1 hypothetical protein [Stenotrophomonas maltophilia]